MATRLLVLVGVLLAGGARAANADALPLPTVHLAVKDDVAPPIEPRKRGFKLRSGTRLSPTVHIVPPAIGSAGDPTLGGAVLTIFNVGGPAQSATYALAAEHWRMIGSPEHFKGWHFHEPSPIDGPIVRVFVKPDKLFVSGGRESWTYLLGPVPQGTVAVRIALGTDDGWCVEAPAKPPASSYDTPARFVGEKGTMPASCTPLP
jgi:hypothetical protein